MTYEQLLNAQKKYGSEISDICRYALSADVEEIRENVILAPCWVPQSMPEMGNATLLSTAKNANIKVYDVEKNGKYFSYINTGIGGPMVTEAVLALGTTKCKNVLLLGSVGAADENFEIGDLIVAKSAINGLGTPFYMMQDCISGENMMGKEIFPDKDFAEKVLATIDKNCHHASVFSTDSLFCQFAHMDEIMGFGAKAMDMEAAAVFCAANLAGIKAAALFAVSDSTAKNKSLVSGRQEDELSHYRNVRKKIIPEIIHKLFDLK